jgi:F420-dependent oxidoreductase-like protein
MQYGIKTSPQLTTWEDMLAVWQKADEMEEFHSIWNFDHFYPINVPDTTGPCMEAWVTLSALAQATARIRVGCMVTGVVYRHPALLANMIASLDIVSKGRLELGIGAGWNEEECDAYGIELGTLTERFDRFDEACEIIHSMMTNEVTNFTGKYFNLKNARNNPPPVQKPHPPICIGGNGEKRTLPNVARWAQHWNYAAFDFDGWVAKKAVLDGICKDQGRDPNEIMTSIHQAADAEALGELEENCKKFRDAGLDLMLFYLPPPHETPILESLADIARRVG